MKAFHLLIVTLFTASSLVAQVGNELYRPVFHYTPGFNWMSDPNGLVYYNGKYHMFYQYNPVGVQPANMSWGHAVSSNLITWEEKSVAIPVQNGVQAYSGSVVVDWNNTSGFGINGKPPLVAIYTGASNVQDQRLAYSNDDGVTWTNYSQNPVITSNNKNFRDPKVIWHKESQKWIMVVSQGNYKTIIFYSSPNLKTWTPMQAFGPIGNVSGLWECPDFFKLSSDNDSTKPKWVLVHSVSPNAQFFIGDFNGQHFNWDNTTPNSILIDDFESNAYHNWTISGSSFATSPSMGTTAVAGYLGKKLTRSYYNGNGSQGKLVSANFIIQKKNISFLIGGGCHPETAYIKLVVNGEAVRKSTGLNDDLLKWQNWDVSSLIGKTAHIEIVDSATGNWGHINVDHIIQSDISNGENSGQVDYGKDFYALQSFSDMPDGRRIWLGWLNNWNYATQVPTTPWKGIMSIPREVKLETHNGQLKLVQKPIEELKAFRKNGLSFKNTSLGAINNSLRTVIGNSLNAPVFKQFELKAKIAVLDNEGFSLKFKKNGLQYSEFVFDFINKVIRFDRSHSGGLTADQNFRDIQFAPLVIEDGFIDLHLFVDNCSVELFSGGGQVVMSNQIFPDGTSNKVELASLNGDLVFEEFDIWKMGKPVLTPNPVTVFKYPLFHVYPNPVVNSNGITIKIKDEVAGNVKFKLFNANGMLVLEFQPSANSIIIPRNKLSESKGMYFLTGSTGTDTQVEKLLVLGH